MIFACVYVGIEPARPCNNHATLARIDVNLLPRLLGMIIAWSLVNLLPGFTGLPYTRVCMDKKMTGQKLDTSKPPARWAGGSGFPGDP